MTLSQQAVTIAVCALATMATRFLPFVVFSSRRGTPPFVQYLGKALPCAVFGMLLVYCLKDVSVFTGNHALPEAIAIAATCALHFWKKQMLFSIAGGTAVYMLLLRFVFA